MRIAVCVKEMITNDIQLVVSQQTEPLKHEIQELKNENEEMKLKIYELEQFSRRPLVRFNGIPETASENTTQLVS